MALRNIHDNIKTALSTNAPLQVYHLVKFEKPSQLDHEAREASDYVYLTDAAYPVEYESQTYQPGGLLKVGKVPESIEAKATNLTLTLSATKLGKQSGSFSLSCGIIASKAQGVLTVNLDLFKSGFYPGDIVSFTPTGSGSSFKGRIDSLYEEGTKIKITNVGTTSIPSTNANYRAEFKSSEIDALVAGGISTDSSGNTVFSPVSFDNYINRSVTIYRVFSNSSTGVQIGDPVVLFKGIIAKGTLNEKPGTSSTITWSLTSHWGDFVRVAGRITSDEFHRGLDSSGLSNIDSAIRSDYVSDLGFEHADSSLNVVASYTDIGTKYKMVRRGGLAGLFGGKKVKEEKFELTRELDLTMDLASKYIPLVYGVQKVDPIPVFADVQIIKDTNNNDLNASGSTNLFQAQVLCEGPIGGVYDIYMEDKGLICRDKADSDTRSSTSNDTPCVGRMDKGDVLGGSSLFSSSLLTSDTYGAQFALTEEDLRVDPNVPFSMPRLFGINSLFQNKRVASDGLQHRESFRFPEANNIQLTVHTGKENQAVDQTLLTLATNVDFLVQQDYYKGDETLYWTENHKLLDTAYVVTKDVINADDGRAPDLSFVVRGKFIDCHNYDGSYKISSGTTANFNLGDSVSITLANNTSGGGATVIDKWSFLNASGSTESRIRFSFDNESTYNSIVRDGTAGKFTATKSGVGSLTFISPGYSNNPSFPVTSTTPTPFGDLVVKGSGFNSLSLPLTRTITVTSDLVDFRGIDGEEDGAPREVPRTHYKYVINFSSLSTDAKTILKIIKETNGSITLTGTSNSQTRELHLNLDSLNSSNMTYTVVGQTLPLDSLLGGSSNAAGTSSTTITNSSITNYSLLTQNSGDSTNSTDVAGLNIEVTKTDLATDNFSILIPSTSSLKTYCNTNNILVLSRELPFRFRTATGVDASYKYGIQGSHLDTGLYTDARVSINPAMQLLDYLTSKRYGKGLDVGKDLDLSSFKEVARNCDTNSDVYLLFPNNTSFTVGHKYRYPATGDLQWQGTVKSFEGVSKDGVNYEQVLFEDCIGKLGKKWYNWRTYSAGEIVWSKNGKWKLISSTGTTNEPTSVSTSNVSIKNLTTTSTVNINTTQHTNLGNPFVKQIDSNNNVVTGYTLYDSDDVKYWKYMGWDDLDQRYVTRHQTNATIDTSRPVFDNVNSMLRQFNGILRFANGKYFLDQKVKAKDISLFGADETVTKDDIVGNIKISDKGISKTFNSVNAQIIDPSNNFEARSIAFYNSNYKKQDKGIPRQGSYEAPGISNYFNARLNIKQVLDESRAGLEVSFTMAPRGYLLLAGNIIAISYDRFNWTKKLFRIENINTRDDLLVDIVAKEHNDSAYLIDAAPSDLVAQYNTSQPGQPNILPYPIKAASVSATTNGYGGVNLTWTNASNYSDGHYIEVFRSVDQSFLGTEVTAGNFVVGETYTIQTPGNTNFVSIGANDNNAGTEFIATGAGTENGTAKRTATLVGLGRGTEYTDSITEEGESTFYYWLRYTITMNNGPQSGNVVSLFEPRKTANGTQGVSKDAHGINASVAILSANQYVIPYSEANAESTTLTFTAKAVNFAAGVNRQYKFFVNNVQKQVSTETADSKTFVLAQSDEPAANTQKTVRVEITQGSVTAEDSTSIYGVRDGVDAFTTVLTNEAHSIPADENGLALSYANSGTDIRVFHGSTPLTYATSGANTFSVTASASSITVASGSNVTTTDFNGVNNNTRSFGVASAMANADTSASITFTITARDAAGVATTLTRVQTFTKGNAGASAKVVNLTADKYVIPYDVDEDENTTITFTATAKNIAGSKIYKFYVDNTLITQTGGTQTSSANQVTCTLPDSLEPTNGQQKAIRVDVEQPSGTIIASDSTSIYGVKDGEDAFTTVLTNESHTIPATSAGAAKTYANSGTDIRVFRGSTPLTYAASGANTFSVVAAASGLVSGDTKIGGASLVQFAVANDTRRYANLQAGAMANATTSAFITFTITARNQEGTGTTLTKVQSFTKGNDGISSAVDIIFQRKTTQPTPNPPTASSGVPTSEGWTTNPPTNSTATLWASNGNKSGGASNYTWSESYKVEANVVAELQIFSDVKANGAASPAVPSATKTNSVQSTYNFTDSTLTIGDADWNKSPPTLANNGDTVYVCTALATAQSPTETAAGITWGTPVVYSKKTDGAPGTDGVSLNLTASPVLFTKDGSTYDPGSTSTLSLSAFGGTITGVTWSTSAGTLSATSGVAETAGKTLTFDADRSIAQINASATVSAAVTGTTSDNTTNVNFGTVTAKISTSIQGADGATPPAASPGTNAPRTATGFVYSTQNSTDPSATNYDFSNNTFTSLNSNWSLTPPTVSASQTTIYYSRYTSVETVTNNVLQGTGSVSFSDVETGTSFSGLVTFSSGDFSTAGATITEIDGGNIKADSIAANKLTIGEENRTGNRMLLLEQSLKIFQGSNLRVHIGDLSNTDT